MQLGTDARPAMTARYVKTAALNKNPINWKNFYSNHPAYVKLGEVQSGVIIGFVWPEDGPLPDHLAYCTPYEEDIIRARRTINGRSLTRQMPRAAAAISSLFPAKSQKV